MTRKVFTAIDMLEQAEGLPTPEGYSILTKEFTRWLRAELERLYDLERAARDLALDLQHGSTIPGPGSPLLRPFLDGPDE